MRACGLRESDLEETFVRSSGAGGQKVNKCSTCVQLRHLPSGRIVKMQKSRSQGMNRFYARRRMCDLLQADQLGPDSDRQHTIDKIRKQKDRRKRRSRSQH